MPMASVFLYHVVADLTVGKPELVEFCETETVEAAIKAIDNSTECGIPVWKKKQHVGVENTEMRQQRFVGILNSLDIVAFFARSESLEDHDKALKTPVSDVVVHNNYLLRQVDPGTRLIDALEMMKHGVKRLLVRKSVVWQGMSKRFSVLYNGKWLKSLDTSNSGKDLAASSNRPSSSSSTTGRCDKFCCLSREDVIRFLIGCLGALAPLPLSSISSLGAINSNYKSIEATSDAIEATQKLPEDPSAVAVLEQSQDGQYKIIGEISASKLWKCDHFAAAWALANLSGGQFVMGVEDNVSRSQKNFSVDQAAGNNNLVNGGGSPKSKKFSSRSIGFNPANPSLAMSRSMYRGRSAALTCKVTSSLAAVMAQMLSHRATHVWVTDDESDDILVGVVGYADIMVAVTRQPSSVAPQPGQSTESSGIVNEIHL